MVTISDPVSPVYGKNMKRTATTEMIPNNNSKMLTLEEDLLTAGTTLLHIIFPLLLSVKLTMTYIIVAANESNNVQN